MLCHLCHCLLKCGVYQVLHGEWVQISGAQQAPEYSLVSLIVTSLSLLLQVIGSPPSNLALIVEHQFVQESSLHYWTLSLLKLVSLSNFLSLLILSLDNGISETKQKNIRQSPFKISDIVGRTPSCSRREDAFSLVAFCHSSLSKNKINQYTTISSFPAVIIWSYVSDIWTPFLFRNSA